MQAIFLNKFDVEMERWSLSFKAKKENWWELHKKLYDEIYSERFCYPPPFIIEEKYELVSEFDPPKEHSLSDGKTYNQRKDMVSIVILTPGVRYNNKTIIRCERYRMYYFAIKLRRKKCKYEIYDKHKNLITIRHHT